MCINIVKHIYAASGGNVKVSKMVIFMKLDINSNLYFLYC